MNNKRGQSAMEFLMTYGWAILAAVIVIGVLASFGVFSPSKYVPTQCVVSAPFGCEKNQVGATNDTISLVLRNGMGSSANLSSIAIAGCGTNSSGIIMADQTTKLVAVTCSPAITSGEKFSGDVTITYRPTGGEIDMKSSGSVTVEVA